MLAITTYCTKSYTYALEAQIPLCIQALQIAKIKNAVFIMAGDKSDKVKDVFSIYSDALKRMGIASVLLSLDVVCNENANHQKGSNLVIANLQHAAWQEARLQGASMCWSLESDILPQPKALRALIDTINFDGGWYDVAMAAYPNSEFLGGRGTPKNWILPTVYPDEKLISEELQKRIDAKEVRSKELIEAKEQPTDEDKEEWTEIDKLVKESPPKANTNALNGERWRQRGWLSSAYPGIGMGAILPTDWVGLGCTLFSEKALQLANFTGYDGGGTQDLWLTWKAWQPAGLRMAVVPHVLCDHVKLRRDTKEGTTKLEVLHAEHEIWSEYHGHLRTKSRQWEGI